MSTSTSGELHFEGVVNPATGQLLGPDTRGRVWEVTGATYDIETDRTTVYADAKEN